MLRIVPWSCREEWLKTYHNLYSNEQQMKGLKQVDIWRSRSGSKLPLAVELTASLIEAGLTDGTSHLSPYVVRHIMAMAIVRFVNGMVDMEQKGAYARSVQSIADEIGLPDWLVDLRHEATHANLPSLEVLRAGHKFALDWLQIHYWESQIVEFGKRDGELIMLLQEYAKLCKNFKSGKRVGKNAKVKKLAQEIADVVGKYNMWQTILDSSFGEKGLLQLSSEILQEIFPESSDIKTTETLFELPTEAIHWLSLLLKALHKMNEQFLSNFLSFLVKQIHELEQQNPDKLRVHFLSCMVYFVLLNCSRKGAEKKQWKINADLDYLLLLKVCLQNPSVNNQRFLPIIIDNLETLSETLKNKLCTFSTIIMPYSKDKILTKSMKNTKTDLEILKQHFPQIATQVEARLIEPQKDSSVWQPCPPSFASTYKFGAFISEEPRQEQDWDEVDQIFTEVETPLENDASMEGCEEGLEDWQGTENEDENEVDDDMNEEPEEMPDASETSDVSAMNELTEKMIQDISKNISIF